MMRTVNLSCPANWSQLTNSQLRFVAKLFLSEWSKEKYKFLSHALIRFSGIKVRKVPIRINKEKKYLVKVKGEKPFAISPGQVTAAADKLSWLLDTVEETKPIRSILFCRPCDQRMYNTMFTQFINAEIFYSGFQQTKDVKMLNRLVATIYHLPWQRFNENKIKRRSWKFALVPTHIKYTVFLWYSGLHWHVSNECPNLFEKGGSGKVNVKDHVMGMIRGLTEGDVTKNEMVQMKTPTWEALYELEQKAKHVKEINAKMKKK